MGETDNSDTDQLAEHPDRDHSDVSDTELTDPVVHHQHHQYAHRRFQQSYSQRTRACSEILLQDLRKDKLYSKTQKCSTGEGCVKLEE